MAVGIGCASLAACELGDPRAYPESGDYSPYPVYAAFLEAKEGGRYEYIVVSPTFAHSQDPSDRPAFDADPSAIESYLRRLEMVSVLDEAAFPSDVRVDVTTREAIHELTDGEEGCEWERFEETYPHASGTEAFTNVGFSADGKEAVLCAFHDDGCGFGYAGCARLLRPRADSTEWTLEQYIGTADS